MDGRIPLVIGVVGHHTFTSQGHSQLTGLVKSVLGHIQENYPHTQLRIITTLDKGANYVVERAGLAIGIELALVIPQMDDENDLNDSESTDLISSATSCFTLPKSAEIREKSNTRLSSGELQYLQAYAFIARRCHILFAISDDSDIISRIIRFKLTGNMDWIPPEYRGMKNHLYPPDQGPVIKLSLLSLHTHSGDLYEVNYLFPNETDSHQNESTPFEIEDKHNKIRYPGTLDKLDEFNSDVISIREKVEQEKLKFYPLLPDHLTTQLCNEQKNIHGVYMYADALAGFYQKKTRKIINSLYIFSSIMPLVFILYIRVWQKPSVIILYVLLSLLVYLIYWLSRKRKYQVKYLDYRALAEGLRVQFFWRYLELAGKERTLHNKPGDHVLPSSVSDCYLRKQNNVLEWIRDAIRIVSTPDFNNKCRDNMNDCLRVLQEYWIMDQAKYYAKSASRDDLKAKQFDNLVLPLILAGGITSLFLTGLFPFVAEHGMLKNILILCVGYLPAIGGLLKTYVFTMGYEEQARQYERMANDFSNVLNRLGTLSDPEEFKSIIHELGKEALRENGDWVALHRDRPLKVPGAGKSNIIEASIKLHKRNFKNLK